MTDRARTIGIGMVGAGTMAGAHSAALTLLGPLYPAAPLRPGLVVAWHAGFCLYEWLSPYGPAWWVSLVERTHPHASPWGGASLPTFALSFVLALGLGRMRR